MLGIEDKADKILHSGSNKKKLTSRAQHSRTVGHE
jgi:hypothetical protein